jgi:hypothetical protein
MSFLWGAIVGRASAIPYFYPCFFITVLVHRCGRDFERYVFLYLAGFSSLIADCAGVPSSTARTGTATARGSHTSSSRTCTERSPSSQ